MSTKSYVWVGMVVGSFIGSVIPDIWGAGMFSFSSLVLSAVGAIVGIYFGFKLAP
jgi:uncharacterized membrane protein YeaQ/YmgE (transglycosylase-associated protein family)